MPVHIHLGVSYRVAVSSKRNIILIKAFHKIGWALGSSLPDCHIFGHLESILVTSENDIKYNNTAHISRSVSHTICGCVIPSSIQADTRDTLAISAGAIAVRPTKKGQAL